MTAYTSHVEDVRAIRSARDRIAGLIGRYPNVSDTDRREILAFMKEGRHIDIGLLTANDNLKPQLDAFMADHQRHFRITGGDIARLLGVIAAVVLVLWLVWELIRPASM